MPREIDVLQLVKSFAHRNNLTEVEYRPFAQAVQRQARLADKSQPVFRDLSFNPDLVLIPKLFLLAKEKRLALQTSGNEIRSIILPERFAETVLLEYKRMDENPDLPFPDEEGLKMAVPGEWIQALSLDTDLGPVSDTQGERSVPLYRILLPEGLRPILVPSAFVPDKLLEYAVIKLRQYLRKGGNKDFMLNKLTYAFPGKEAQLKDAFGAVLTKPYDALSALKRSGSDFVYSFWAYLVSALKKDLEKRQDKSPEDQATHQAALICEFYASHFKSKAQRIIDTELAFKALDSGLRAPPHNFTLDEILAFRDAKGAPLVSRFSREELEGRLREKSTKADPLSLPEYLLMPAGPRKVFVAKDKALLLAVRLIAEARTDLRARILAQWKPLLEDFRESASMEEDEAFRTELSEQLEERFPLLDSLFRSKLLPLIYEEIKVEGSSPPDLDRLFYKGDLAPLEEILDIGRRDLVSDARMLLPFWYTVPIVSDIMRLLHRLARRREERAAARNKERRVAAKRIESAADRAKESETSKAAVPGRGAEGGAASLAQRRAEFAAAAVKVSKELLPPGYELDAYLRELEGRWNTLLNMEAKKNLTEDVNSLVRDYLRGIARTMSGSSITALRVKNLAATLADTPSLLRIKNHQALETYIQMYMVKALGAGGLRL
jgi:hypothetical protein